MALLSLAFERVGQPSKSFLQSGSLHGTRLKHHPLAVLNLVEAQARGHLVVVHGAGHVLFIGEDQHGHAPQLVLLQHDL